MQKANIFTMLHLTFNTDLVLSFSPFPIDFVVIQHLLNWRGKKHLSFLLATVGGGKVRRSSRGPDRNPTTGCFQILVHELLLSVCTGVKYHCGAASNLSHRGHCYGLVAKVKRPREARREKNWIGWNKRGRKITASHSHWKITESLHKHSSKIGSVTFFQ